ncbi:MAG: hypothetical protein AB7F19_04850 [Candidatus Babeliales bacterium]
MKAIILKTIAVSSFLCLPLALLGSNEDVKKFFQASEKGFYQVLLDLTKNRKLTAQEIMNARDNGNTLISAALQGYKLAVAKYGEPKASQLLYDVLSMLLLRIDKADAVKLVNEATKAGMPPLFMATQLGLLKVAVLLHDKGAFSVTKDGKKASSYAKNAQLKTILAQWENLEDDWVLVGDKK